jgi:hypothetical protein
MRGEKTVFLMSKYQVHKGYMPYLFPDIMLVGFSPFNWETVKDILRVSRKDLRFLITFCVKIHINDVFLFLKNYF